jgi:hypothetical protein
LTRLSGGWSRQRVTAVSVIFLALALTAGSILYVLALQDRYRNARVRADAVHERYSGSDVASLRPEDLPQLTEDLGQLESDLKHLQELADAPLLGGLARHAPLVGDDVKASQDLLDLGVELATIARQVSVIANDIRLAFETTGMLVDSGAAGPTWLDVVRDNRHQIDELATRFDAALSRRASLDVAHLPQRGRDLLLQVDQILIQATDLRDEYVSVLPLLDTAFGANGEARYVILLQNREEIRPGGGFPGTYAIISLSDGRVSSYVIDDIHALDRTYVAHRQRVIPAPGPIRTVIGQQELLPHDALWSPDFREAAQTFLTMYDQTDQPSLTGVIGLSDSSVQHLLTITGPYQVDINGQQQLVTADNFLQQIESYRDVTWQDLAAHKQVVALLGASLIERVKAADFETKKRIYYALREDADRREIQIFLPTPAMQAEVTKRGWDGALHPATGTPTLAMTVAGLTGGKKALTIFAASSVNIEPFSSGTRVRWTVTLDHRGDPRGNQVYNGYEYAWLSLHLPDGARVVSTSRDPAPAEVANDPGAISFGIGIMPGTSHSVTVEFVLATSIDGLLVRRQAGFNDVAVRVTGNTESCLIDWSFTLSRDYLVQFSACAALPAR